MSDCRKLKLIVVVNDDYPFVVDRVFARFCIFIYFFYLMHGTKLFTICLITYDGTFIRLPLKEEFKKRGTLFMNLREFQVFRCQE